jgi:hypothetical protein
MLRIRDTFYPLSGIIIPDLESLGCETLFGENTKISQLHNCPKHPPSAHPPGSIYRKSLKSLTTPYTDNSKAF